MSVAPGRHAGLARYLLEGEQVVVAVHQHWAKVAEPIGSTALGAVVALWVDAHIPSALGGVSTLLWWGWFALVARLLYRLAQWRHDWFVATDKRLLLFYGLVTRRVSMMPLMKVTDMSYERSVPGRLLGFGRFVMESAGHDQALRKVNWVPRPDHHYRVICAVIFGAGDPMAMPEEAPWAVSWEVSGEDSRAHVPPPGPRGIPDPYAGWDRSRSSADTGPITIRPRWRDRWDD